MKLSSISLIAAALAAIMGSAATAPTVHPVEQNSLEGDVNIYTRGQFLSNLRNYPKHHQEVAKEAEAAIEICKKALELASQHHDTDSEVIKRLKANLVTLDVMKTNHDKWSCQERNSKYYKYIPNHLGLIEGCKKEADDVIEKNQHHS